MHLCVSVPSKVLDTFPGHVNFQSPTEQVYVCNFEKQWSIWLLYIAPCQALRRI